jgi:acyl-CoA thioesterase FadM
LVQLIVPSRELSSFRREGRDDVHVDRDIAGVQHTQFTREVLAGSLLHVRTELVALGRTSIRFLHHMFDSETNEEVATTELVGVYFDTAIRAWIR